jgi:hypothetical protein
MILRLWRKGQPIGPNHRPSDQNERSEMIISHPFRNQISCGMIFFRPYRPILFSTVRQCNGANWS